MSLEPQSVCDGTFGSLQGCLVEGDPAQRQRERSIRRRALIFSVIVQSAVLAVVVLIPLFAKPAPIAMPIVVPLPPYHHGGAPQRIVQQRSHIRRLCFQCVTSRPVDLNRVTRNEPNQEKEITGEIGNGGPAKPCPECINMGNVEGPRPPVANETRSTKPRIVHETHIDPAMLIHRVEPVFPIVPKQMHKGGRVELHAIIATDGTIQSLEVVSGDVLFYRSAMDAVRQWRYRATVLNGQPVEVDTFITVIYTIE